MSTFVHRYCALHGLPVERFEESVLRRALYPQARLAFPLINAVDPEFFEMDRDLVRMVGRLRHLRHFREACTDYRHYLAHASPARRYLRLRLSVRALYKLAAETMSRTDVVAAPAPALPHQARN